ncbi:MAG: uracil phosphoribosyltransferase [Actinobacteria bacterium]|nr:uracil phosphoribosyltransferase [Actinomycetota bacterium]
MENVILVDHPLIAHKLSHLRDEGTETKRFRELTAEIATLLCYEATKDLVLEEIVIKTPLEETTAKVIKGKKVAVIPILRAGLGMVEGITNLLPAARVGFVGIYRDHDSLQPVQYYSKVPGKMDERLVLVLDPMLATGGSATHAITLLKGEGARDIKLLSIVAAPEGIAAVHAKHPDVTIVVAAIDRGLNEIGYILPGLGDAGDRLFGTR